MQFFKDKKQGLKESRLRERLNQMLKNAENHHKTLQSEHNILYISEDRVINKDLQAIAIEEIEALNYILQDSFWTGDRW